MSNQHMEELNDQQIVRREKMAALAEQGIDPFGKRFERTATSGQLKEKYADKTKSGKPVRKMAFPHKKNRAMSRIFYNLAAVMRIELRARLWYY